MTHADHDELTKTCFVIGPIGDRLAPIGSEDRQRFEDAEQLWEYVIEPACRDTHLHPVRADKIAHPGEITEQIFRLLRDAEVVVADLTGGNANVMYELGLRHSKEAITVQLGENERLPFDINTIRTIRFRRTDIGLAEARNSLVSMLRAALAGEGTPPSASRVWSEVDGGTPVGGGAATETGPVETPPVPDEAPAGFIDILAEGEAALALLAPTMARATQAVKAIGDIAEDMTEEVKASDGRNAGFAGRLTVAAKFAEALKEPTAALEEAAADYVELLSRVDPAVDRLISVAETNEDEREGLREYLLYTAVVARTSQDSMASGAQLAQVYGGIGNISKVITPVAKRIERAVLRIVTATDVMQGWRRRIEVLPGWDENAANRLQAEWSSDEAVPPLNGG